MSLEVSLSSIAASLELIAKAMSVEKNEDAAPVKPVPVAGVVEAAKSVTKKAKTVPVKVVVTEVEPEAADADVSFEEEETFEETHPTAQVTITDVRAALVDLQKRTGSADKSKALLASYKVKTLNDLPENMFASVIYKAKTAA